jgi:CDP-paratose 2-epimerase
MTPPRSVGAPRPYREGDVALITGGAGFIATNVADRLLRNGWRVRILDNLSRAGVEQNVRWLVSRYGARLDTRVGDVRDQEALTSALSGVQRVFHFAAQVAVTTSLVEPFLDFEVNARGTLNLLEAVRTMDRRPSVLFTSTNKVYGNLDDIHLVARGRRYEPADPSIGANGIAEDCPLDFHSPYGCSKGAADQYVLDYARTFDLPATVFRMSCIYGPHQFGTEDQGWVAHFLIQALKRAPLTLYGDGLQVRDVLFAEDLVNAMMLAHDRIDITAGRAFNIGGGPTNTVSLLELLDLIAELTGTEPLYDLEPWRPADQRYYVSNTTAFQELTGWSARVPVAEGVQRLMHWLLEARVVATPAAAVAGKAS